MATLTQQLRNEHKYLVESLEEVYRIGIGSAEAQKKLANIKGVLLQHLSREDNDLYPIIERNLANNPKLGKLAESMREEMQLVSKHAMKFFEKYAAGGSGFEFARDFGQLLSMLSTRVRKEETMLYPEFDKLPGSAQ